MKTKYYPVEDAVNNVSSKLKLDLKTLMIWMKKNSIMLKSMFHSMLSGLNTQIIGREFQR